MLNKKILKSILNVKHVFRLNLVKIARLDMAKIARR